MKSRNDQSCEKLTNDSFVSFEETETVEPLKISWSGYEVHPEYDKLTEGFVELINLNIFYAAQIYTL